MLSARMMSAIYPLQLVYLLRYFFSQFCSFRIRLSKTAEIKMGGNDAQFPIEDDWLFDFYTDAVL